MPEPTRAYTDIDYESFPVADLSLDLHWIQLPKAVLAAREKARGEALRQARDQERAAALPENHKVILVPAHPDHSPIEKELWPVVTHTVHHVLHQFPAAHRAVTEAIAQLRQDYRGWRNPYPASLEWEPEPA